MTTTQVPLRTPRRLATADLVGGIILAVVMGGALYLSRGWDHDAAVFPRAVAAGGLLLSVAVIVKALLGAPAPEVPAEPESVDDNLEYVFHTASLRQWLVTISWFGGFFVALYVVGLYATAIVYTVAYLRTQDNRSWLFSGVYALILVGVLYAAFGLALAQPVPPGFFGLS